MPSGLFDPTGYPKIESSQIEESLGVSAPKFQKGDFFR
jgi:hypothetical protein